MIKSLPDHDNFENHFQDLLNDDKEFARVAPLPHSTVIINVQKIKTLVIMEVNKNKKIKSTIHSKQN